MKVVVIYSGGLDSTTLLYYLRAGMQSAIGSVEEIKAFGVDYGQRHRKELEKARAICDELGIEYQVADLSFMRNLLAGSSQTSDDIPVPEGHYAEESMKSTVVPNRNMIMLSLAIGWAISLKYDAVAYGAHAGDHAIYPDCRPEFVDALSAAAALADWQKIGIVNPFIHQTKAQIVAHGLALGVPFEKTWTCYQGGAIACGRCGTCVERLEAFDWAGAVDPLLYQDRSFYKTAAA